MCSGFSCIYVCLISSRSVFVFFCFAGGRRRWGYIGLVGVRTCADPRFGGLPEGRGGGGGFCQFNHRTEPSLVSLCHLGGGVFQFNNRTEPSLVSLCHLGGGGGLVAVVVFSGVALA